MKRKVIFIVIMCQVLLSYFGCNNSPTRSDDSDNVIVDVRHITVNNYPRVDGSTSAHPLQVVIACNILDVDYRWFEWFDGTLRAFPDYSDTTKTEINDFIGAIKHAGTHGSYVNLIADSADIILVARPPSSDELELADSLGITIETEAIALDAFVFILNTANPVNDLSVAQVQGIYTGNIKNWSDVGGPNALINPYLRERNSGSQELMEELVMKNLKMIDAPDMILFGMMGPINKLVTDPYGIGYTVYFFNNSMAPREAIKVCGINGIAPDPITIGNGSYIYTTRVYAAIRSNLDRNSTAYTVWEWLRTEAGQKVIAESGYVPFVD